MSHRKIILSITLLLSLTFAITSAAMTWNNSSKLNEGRWVKIKVNESGIHQITYEQLHELGFDNPDAVTIHGYGGNMLSHNSFQTTDPDDLPQLMTLHDNNRILFWGQCEDKVTLDNTRKTKVTRNHYAMGGYYFITDSQALLPQTTINFGSKTFNNYRDSHVAINIIQSLDFNPMKAGVHFFSNNMIEDLALGRIKFSIPDHVDGTDATLNGSFLAHSTSPFTINVNGSPIAVNPTVMSSSYYTYDTRGLSINNSLINNTADINLEITPSSAKTSFLAYNFIAVNYTRLNKLGDQPEMKMAFNVASTSDRVRFPGQPNNDFTVWNVTNPAKITRYQTIDDPNAQEGQTATLINLNKTIVASNASTFQYLVAFHPSAKHHDVEIIGPVKNQNLHSLSTPDMLIITTDVCLEQAERLAQLHRQEQGMDVHVVLHQDIYNEFSSGTPTVMAYRRMCKMFYDRDKQKFRYLLLFGSSTYDNRLLKPENQSYTPDKVLLSYQVENNSYQFKNETCYTTDSYFGILDDKSTGDIISGFSDGIMHMLITIGRIPAINETQAKIYVDKAEKYLLEGISPQAQTRMLVFADDGDKDGHLIDAEALASKITDALPYKVTVRAHDGIFPWTGGINVEGRRQIINALTKGVGLMYYAGHGRPDSFTAEALWTRGYAQSTKHEQFPLIYLSTCDAFSFDRQENSIAENMLFSPEGGSIAVIAAARTVYKDENHAMAMEYFNEYTTASDTDTYADIFRRARNNNIDNRQYALARTNTHSYNFGGDPALPAFRPSHSVDISSINGKQPGEEKFTLKPLQNNNIKATITDIEGNPVTDYNGFATITVYESPITVNNRYADGSTGESCKMPSVPWEDDVLFSSKVPVVNGTINADIIIPESARPNETTRLTIAAADNANRYRNAIGYTNNILVGDIDPQNIITDASAPEILAMYLNDTDFTDGQLTTDEPVFHAEIGTSNTTVNIDATLNSGVKLFLDNTLSIPVEIHSATNSDGSISIKAPLSALGEGRHTLSLTVNDIFGNSASESINFQVVAQSAQIILTPDSEVTDNEVTFNVDHTFNTDFHATLIIEDVAGNSIRTINNVTFPYTWDTTDSDGKSVPDGTYIIKTFANNRLNFCGSNKSQIRIIR